MASIGVGFTQTRKRNLKWSDRMLARTSRYFEMILAAGIPIHDALTMLIRTGHSRSTSLIMTGILRTVEKGKSLSASFESFGFPPLYTALIHVGETNGDLVASFHRLQAYYERKAQWTEEWKRALVYPCVLILMLSVLGIVMIVFVIPQFETMYISVGKAMPFTTRLLFAADAWMRKYGTGLCLVLAIVVVIAGVAWRRWLSRLVMHRALRVPVAGSFLRHTNSHLFAQLFGLLLGSGLSAFDAVQTVCQLRVSEELQTVFQSVRAHLEEGLPISESINQTESLDSFLPTMLSVGERTGTIAESLCAAEEFYRQSIEHTLRTAIRLVEPVLLLVLGGWIGAFIVTLFLPMSTLIRDMSR